MADESESPTSPESASTALGVTSAVLGGTSIRVLVVEDDTALSKQLVRLLERAGCIAQSIDHGGEALLELDREVYDVVLLDLHLPGMHGLDVLTAATARGTDAQFIVMTGAGSIEFAVDAMKAGAFDFLSKPFEFERLMLTIRHAVEQLGLRREVARLRREAGPPADGPLHGRSPAMRNLLDLIERVAPTRAAVLLMGETGTGKELAARLVHDLSGRSGRFVTVNCSALAETLLESELFGHVKGAFTGADHARRGLIEEASGGTLFLDEIGDVSAPTQVRLLRVLQERTVTPVGGNVPVTVDFRLVVATNKDLRRLVEEGDFRQDLYFRLSTFPVEVPPLRDRREDIPLLIGIFATRFAGENQMEPPSFGASVLERVAAYDWPGNVRELEHFVERAMILNLGSDTVFNAPFGTPDQAGEVPEDIERALNEGWTLERHEREYILHVLDRCGWNKAASAEVLGIDRSTLYRKLKKLEADGFVQPTNTEGGEAAG